MKTLKSLLYAVITAPVFAGGPSIQFTYVPPTGSYANVTGQVTGVSPSTYGVALFINVFGTYWTKPYTVQPITALNTSGSFSASITTGGAYSLDAYAEQVIGYVVPLSYTSIPILQGASAMPQEIIDHSVASVVANKFTPISFSNYYWEVKNTGNGRWGPGGPPNYFTGDNVTVDNQGRLHLAVAYINGAWRCAEVILTNSFGYGTYRLWLDSSLSSLPPNIVFGFFTWNNAPSIYQNTYREIDIEFSNGDVVSAPDNWQYVVQPYYLTQNRLRFSAPASVMGMSHTFTWMPGAVYFESYLGHIGDQRTLSLEASPDLRNWASLGTLDVTPDYTGNVWIIGPEYQQQFYRTAMASCTAIPRPFKTAWLTNSIPPPGGEQIHLNLWLFQGAAPSPSTTDRFEVIISKVEFIPLVDIQPTLQITQVTTNQTKLLLKYRAN